MAAQPGDKVKLEAMISIETTSSGEFAVVVLVTAPAVLGTEQSDAGASARGVDLVAVLDVSGGMNEDNRLERMKEAMFSVLDQLGEHDRLCILSFNDEVRQLTELRFMSNEEWDNATAKVEELTAPARGGANVKAATEEAAKILAQRGEEEQRDRVGRVIFLSSGDEDDAVADAGSSEEQNHANASPDVALTPDAFVLGADDKLSPLSFSAGNTSAAYSYVKDSVDKIQDAPGLTSVDPALAVQIDLHAQDGVALSSVESGGHPVPFGPGGPRSLTIYIQDLYAGEQKSFTVYLTVPEGKEELLAVTGWYRDPESGEDTQLDVCEVSVPRPNAATPVDEATKPQETAPGENDQDTPDTPEEETNPGENQDTPDSPVEETNPGENQDTPDIPEEETNPGENQDTPDTPKEETNPGENQGMPASVPVQVEIPPVQTVRDASSIIVAIVLWLSGMFAAILNLLSWVWDSVAKQANILKKEEERKLGKVRNVWTWARNNAYPCALALLLLGAAMLLMPKKGEDDRKGSSLGVSQHPGWPRVEESFDLVMLKEMGSAGITSCSNSALVADMCPAMNRYIYQAIVRGTGFHVPLLEQTAQMLEVEKAAKEQMATARHQQGEE